MSRRSEKATDPRLSELLDVIFRFAAGDLAARGTVTDDNTSLDAIMAGINILGEELEANVAENERASESLRSASLYTRSLIEASLDPLMTISSDGTILDVNGATSRVTGTARERLIGSNCSGYFTEPEAAAAAYREAFANGFVTNCPLVMLHASGATIETLFNGSVYRDDTGAIAGVLAIARDITDRRRAERAEELVTRDGLTNLYNHRAFYSFLTDEIARADRFHRPLSVLMLDIDHFKHVNDRYGHPIGDSILLQLSEVLVTRARAIDRVCRYGGEEFAVILPETDAQLAVVMAERLRTAVEQQRFDIGDEKPITVTVSIGVAAHLEGLRTPGELVKAADVALYQAKRNGRNQTSSSEVRDDLARHDIIAN